MELSEIPLEGRDYHRILKAILDVFRSLDVDGDQNEALRQSFEETAAGFGAEKALLLRVDEGGKLTNLYATGLSAAQIAAMEKGESLRGVSHTIIREVIASRALQVMPHPAFRRKAGVTKAFTEQDDFSVLCGPILDPSRETVRAIMYFQNSGGPTYTRAYREADARFLQTYTEALQRVFNVYFQKQQTERQYEDLVAGGERPADAPDIIGNSTDTTKLRSALHEIWIPSIDTDEPAPILIHGETGVGKDLIARYLHAWSSRAKKPFVVCNAGTIDHSASMARAQFHGHTKNAFTGADREEPGYFRAAQGGVLFIDEIGELSEQGQLSLLRPIDNFRISPLGETKEYPVDVVVILATNRNLELAVRDGIIRKDFLARFKTQTIHITPLRERPEDILPLLDHYLHDRERKSRKKTAGLTDEALKTLLTYAWPLNVREIRTVSTSLINAARKGEHIDLALLERCYPDAIHGARNPSAATEAELSLDDATHNFQKELLRERLDRHRADVTATAESLGIVRSTFYRLAERVGLEIREEAEQ